MRRYSTAISILLGCALLLGCQSDEAKLADHLERGDQYSDAESWDEAIIEYKNVLQIDPKNATAHFKLSQAYLRSDMPREAFWELRETVRLDPDNHDAKLQFAQISVFAGEIEDALKHADEVAVADPTRADAFMVKGQAYEALKQIPEARVALERATELEPENKGARLLLATFLRRQGDREAAEPHYVKAAEIDEAPASLLALGGFYAEEKRDAEAETAFRKALDMAEGDDIVTAYRTLGAFFYQRERFDEAAEVLEAGTAKAENPVSLIYMLARMYRDRGETAKADELALRATEANPNDPGPFLVLSSYRGQVGDLEGALEAARAAAKVAPPDDPSADLRSSEILVEMGFREDDPEKVEEGRKIVDEVLDRDSDNPAALFVKAKLDIAESNTEDGIRRLRAAIDLQPDWAKAHFLLGTALAMTGERTAARTELARALEIDPSIHDARSVLVDVHAALGEHEYAIEEGRRYLKLRPEAAKTRLRVAQSLVLLGRHDEALEEVEHIDEGSRTVEINYAIGRIYFGMGNAEQARVHLERALEQSPSNADILRSLLDIDRREDRLDESAARIAKAVEASPDDAKLQQLAGRLALVQGRGADAEAAFKRAIELAPELISSYRQLAQFYARTGRTGETIETYEKALAVKPDQPQVHHFLGVLYEYGGERDLAVEHYEKAIRFEPNLGEAKNNLAYIYAETGENLDRALDLAQEAKALMPDNPNTADTLGWVLYRRGVPSAAVGYLKEAVAGIGPEDGNRGLVRHHLALAYEASGDTERAREAAELAIADHDQFVESQKSAGATPGAEPKWIAEARELIERLTGLEAADSG